MHDIFVPWVQNQVVILNIYCAQNQVGCLIMDRFAESPRDCGSGKDVDVCGSRHLHSTKHPDHG